jgi:hypothetical protein
MKTKRRFLSYSLSILFFSTLISGANQVSIPARAASPETFNNLKPTAISNRWLEGIWEGTAYQSNTRENWTIKVTVHNGTYRIDYPSLSCGGEWKLISMDASTAKFKEKLTYGQDSCVNDGNVTIQKLNNFQVAYWYVEPNQTRVTAIAVLDRR